MNDIQLIVTWFISLIMLMSCSQFCSFRQTPGSKGCDMPCLKFFWKDSTDIHLEKAAHIFSSTICPVLLETIIKGTSQPFILYCFHIRNYIFTCKKWLLSLTCYITASSPVVTLIDLMTNIFAN